MRSRRRRAAETSSRARRTSAASASSRPARAHGEVGLQPIQPGCGRADRRAPGRRAGALPQAAATGWRAQPRACGCRSVGGCATTRVLRPLAPESTAARSGVSQVGSASARVSHSRASSAKCAALAGQHARAPGVAAQFGVGLRRSAYTARKPPVAVPGEARSQSARRRSARLAGFFGEACSAATGHGFFGTRRRRLISSQ